MELEKFTKGQKLRIAKVPFAKLPELLIDKAMAYAVNPLGFNLVLNREQLNKIIGLNVFLLQKMLVCARICVTQKGEENV